MADVIIRNIMKEGLNREKNSFKIKARDGIQKFKNLQKKKVYWTTEEPRKGIIKRVNRYLNRRRYYWRKEGKKPRTEFEWEELLKQ